MAPIVRCRSPLFPEIGGIDWSVEEWDLIIVGVVVCLRQRISDAEPVAAIEWTIQRDQQAVVLRLRARLDVDDAIGPADDRIVDLAHLATDEKVNALVVHHVDACTQSTYRLLGSQVKLVYRRVLKMRVDDVDTGRTGTWKDERRKWGAPPRRDGGKSPGCRIEEEHVAGAHLDRQRASVESSFERLDL